MDSAQIRDLIKKGLVVTVPKNHTMKSYRKCGGRAVCILDLGVTVR
jgi:hypothetical protein